MTLLKTAMQCVGLKPSEDFFIELREKRTQTDQIFDIEPYDSHHILAKVMTTGDREKITRIDKWQFYQIMREYRTGRLARKTRNQNNASHDDECMLFISHLSKQIASFPYTAVCESESISEAMEQATIAEDQRYNNWIKKYTNLASNNANQSAPVPILAVVIAIRSYPYGGGETYLLESCRWLQELGHKVILINTRNEDWSLIQKNSVSVVRGIVRIGFAGIDTDDALVMLTEKIINLLNPDFIHSQGEVNPILCNHMKPWWPLICCGYHFWTGIVDLRDGNNAGIRQNIKHHSLNPSFENALSKPNFTFYTVSQFMAGILMELRPSIISPILSPLEKPTNLNLLQSTAIDSTSRESVLQINCSVKKGGLIFGELALRLKHITFKGLCATYQELLELYHELVELNPDKIRMQQQTISIGENGTISAYYDHDISDVLNRSKVLLMPSLVDETFSRVVVEALTHNTPVISSGNGNMKNLLPENDCISTDRIDIWEQRVWAIMTSKSEHDITLQAQKAYLDRQMVCGKKAFCSFLNNDIIPKIQKKNVVIVCPWSEQGLGYHAKLYADSLNLIGVNAHIFSFQPYKAIGCSHTIQTDNSEWNTYNVHYSLNDRESLSAHEIAQFCHINRSKIVIWPEVCWQKNWDRLFTLGVNYLDIVVVPNPETLRITEIDNHNRCSAVLASTRLCEEILAANGVENVQYIGHAVERLMNEAEASKRLEHLRRSDKIRLLHIAGYNHRRKMTDETISTLAPFIRDNPQFELVVLSQIPFSSIATNAAAMVGGNRIQLINRDLSRHEIFGEIDQASVTLQLSSHEGLGLGFYESLSRGVPVITVNTAPHNEHIVDGLTGFLVEGSTFDLYDNSESLIKGFRFSPKSLVASVSGLSLLKLSQMSLECIRYCEQNLSLNDFSRRFGAALRLL